MKAYVIFNQNTVIAVCEDLEDAKRYVENSRASEAWWRAEFLDSDVYLGNAWRIETKQFYSKSEQS